MLTLKLRQVFSAFVFHLQELVDKHKLAPKARTRVSCYSSKETQTSQSSLLKTTIITQLLIRVISAVAMPAQHHEQLAPEYLLPATKMNSNRTDVT